VEKQARLSRIDAFGCLKVETRSPPREDHAPCRMHSRLLVPPGSPEQVLEVEALRKPRCGSDCQRLVETRPASVAARHSARGVGLQYEESQLCFLRQRESPDQSSDGPRQTATLLPRRQAGESDDHHQYDEARLVSL